MDHGSVGTCQDIRGSTGGRATLSKHVASCFDWDFARKIYRATTVHRRYCPLPPGQRWTGVVVLRSACNRYEPPFFHTIHYCSNVIMDSTTMLFCDGMMLRSIIFILHVFVNCYNIWSQTIQAFYGKTYFGKHTLWL